MRKENQVKPWILWTIFLSMGLFSCAGNSYLETPAMDYIAENDIRFT